MTTIASSGPAPRAVAITPSDTAIFNQASRAIYVGASGNLNVRMDDGMDCLFANVPAGTVLPIQATKVYKTRTTAQNLVRMW